MKSALAVFAGLLSLSVILTACSGSSSSGGNGGGTPGAQAPLTPFEKATGGTWQSECQRDEHGQAFTDEFVLNQGGTGSITISNYDTADCTGDVSAKQAPIAFTYVVNGAAANGSSKVTLSFTGQTAIVFVQSQGDTMTVTSDKGRVNYQRIAGAPGVPTDGGQGQAPAGGSFEAVALGNWMSKDCYQVSDTQSAILVLTIAQGHGSSIQNTYNSLNCTGNPQGANKHDFTYTVDRYANGGGQLTIDAKSPVDVTIQANQMTITDQSGSVTYVRAK